MSGSRNPRQDTPEEEDTDLQPLMEYLRYQALGVEQHACQTNAVQGQTGQNDERFYNTQPRNYENQMQNRQWQVLGQHRTEPGAVQGYLIHPGQYQGIRQSQYELGEYTQMPLRPNQPAPMLPSSSTNVLPGSGLMHNPSIQDNQEQPTTGSDYQGGGQPPRISQTASTTRAQPQTGTGGQIPEGPTTNSVASRGRHLAPLSRQPLQRRSANEPIPSQPVVLPKHWRSGCDHFAFYDAGTGHPGKYSQRLKYPLKLERTRRQASNERTGYAPNFPDGSTTLPARTSLLELMQNFPNHAWGEGLRLLMAEGVSPLELYENLPEEARHTRAVSRQHNYIQHAYGREMFKMEEERTGVRRQPSNRGQSSTLEDNGSDGRASSKKRRTVSESSASPSDVSPTVSLSGPVDVEQQPQRQNETRRQLTLGQWERIQRPLDESAQHLRGVWAQHISTWKQLAHRYLRLTDPDYAAKPAAVQVLCLEESWENVAAAYSADIRRNSGLPPTGVQGADSNPALWMREALLRSPQGAQLPGEPGAMYRERIERVAFRSLITWFDTRLRPTFTNLLRELHQHIHGQNFLLQEFHFQTRLPEDPASTDEEAPSPELD